MYLPKHEASLQITHNEHKDCYQTAEEWLKEHEEYYSSTKSSGLSWESEEEKKKAIAEDSIWVMQWHPRTPVCFHEIAASSLDSLIAYAKRVEEEG